MILYEGSRDPYDAHNLQVRGGIQIMCFLVSYFPHDEMFYGTAHAFNEYLQHMLLWRNNQLNKKNFNIYWLRKVPYVELCA